MIALQAFTGRKGFTDYVYEILEAYGERMRGGIIPNMIGEGGDGTNYDTVDASLWYVLRVFECFDEFEARKKKTLFSFCGEIVLSYLMSNDLAFFCDRRDGLVELRRGTNLALTWMDAKIYGVPVTPRYGKPVEVNGLWYNAVKAVIDMAGKIGADSLRRGGNFLRQKGSGRRSPADGKKPGPLSERSLTLTELEALAVEIRESMGKFFHEGIWCDRIEEGTPVSEIRPNYVIALSLPFDFTDREGIQRGLDCARVHLLTPYGLRSLARNSPMFRRKYVGNQKMRDLAYHQGTVWTWLLLPYAQLLRKLTDDRVKLKEALEELVFPLKCAVRKGVLVSLPEVWDGEDPAVPKGAPAQAWSVAALHFIERMIESC